MKVNVMLDEGAFLPEKAHNADAGFDIRTPNKFTLLGHGSATVDTGVHIQIPEGFVGFLKSKSGLNVKSGIHGEGVIDSGYTGSIVVKLYNNGDWAHTFERGDKLIQIVLLPIPPVDLQIVSEFPDTERGNNGFGSSGK